MLWECSVCGATTEYRRRVCPDCGTATRYTRLTAADADTSYEVGSLRELWVSEGASRAQAPLFTR